ncbi:hypothetical protein [Jiangella alkaliphila]|uniref:Uncharacterized protein n=1 Tax=Jiangella alkaliphila TaxID=419479 RepID=A0A1H2IFE4_9ACTN|nr:hypothetical protein [Jiangella alkaliphila]SDU42721.1 hypothetical protein SAMN04488563_1666 [Jiangella alkaliphila]
MGFEVNLTTLRLRFTDPSFDGAQVTVRMVDGDTLAAAAELKDVDIATVSPDMLKQLLDGFADALIDWNLEIKGRRVNPTRAGLRKFDVLFQLELVKAWLSSYGEVLEALKAAGQEAAELESTLKVAPLTHQP